MGDVEEAMAVGQETVEWLEWHDGAPGAELHSDPDVTWLVQQGAAWGNAAAWVRFSADTLAARLDSLIGRYRKEGRGAGFWIGPFATPSRIGAELKARGFRCRKHFPGMYSRLDGLNGRAAPEGIRIGPVENCLVFASARWQREGRGGSGTLRPGRTVSRSGCAPFFWAGRRGSTTSG